MVNESEATTLEILDEQNKSTRRIWRNEWNKHSLIFRMTHKDNGHNAYGSLTFLIVVMITAVAFFSVYWIPANSIGGLNYHLQNGINYECSGGDWNGNTTQMIMVDGGYARYYYCPMDGRLIGVQSFSYPLP